MKTEKFFFLEVFHVHSMQSLCLIAVFQDCTKRYEKYLHKLVSVPLSKEKHKSTLSHLLEFCYFHWLAHKM